MNSTRSVHLVAMVTLALMLGACTKDKSTDSGQATLVVDTLRVAEDAHIQSDVPDGHYGTSPDMSVVTVIYVWGQTVVYRTLVKLPTLPPNFDLSQLVSADLELAYSGTDTSRQIAVIVFPVTEDWHEDSITWNNAPTFDDSVFDSARMSDFRLTINVAPIYLTGNPDRGIMLTTIDGTEQVFHSSEAVDSSLVPVVEIRYAQ